MQRIIGFSFGFSRWLIAGANPHRGIWESERLALAFDLDYGIWKKKKKTSAVMQIILVRFLEWVLLNWLFSPPAIVWDCHFLKKLSVGSCCPHNIWRISDCRSLSYSFKNLLLLLNGMDRTLSVV